MSSGPIGNSARVLKQFLLYAAAPVALGLSVSSEVGFKFPFDLTHTLFDPLLGERTTVNAVLARVTLGGVLIASGRALQHSAHKELDQSVNYWGELVAESGLYSDMRHPHYFADRLVAIGFACLVPSVATLAIAGLVVGTTAIAARGEERYLENQYGEFYTRYKRKVPNRFLFV